LDDDADDVKLIKGELDTLELDLEIEVADSLHSFRSVLDKTLADIIISEYELPDANLLEVLTLARERIPDVPFILCSGFIGEEQAVDAMREGVNDYALKDNLKRLGTAVLRELDHYKVRINRRQERQLIDATFNASGLSVAIIDKDGRFAKVNGRFSELTGYDADELIGMRYSELNEKDKMEEAHEVFHKILSEGGTHTNDWKLIRKDGSVGYVQSTITRIDNVGDDPYIISYVLDISERQRLKAIREQTERVTNVGGWEMDFVLDRVFCNGMVLDIFDLPDGLELTIENLVQQLESESQKLFRDAIDKTVRDSSPFDLILRTVRGNGEKRWIHGTGVPQLVDGRTVRIHGTFRDITVEEEKNEEIRKLSLVASKTHNGVVIFDENGRIEWVNEAFIQATGYRFEEFSGTEFGELLAGEETDDETLKRVKLNFERRVSFEEEILIYTKKGEKRWYRIDVTPVIDDLTNARKFIEIQEDITKSKQLRKERQEALDNLRERVKEQSCLYNISSLDESSLDMLLEKAAHIIPTGWKFPKKAAAAIRYEGITWQSENYEDTDWKLDVERGCLNGKRLNISVVYVEEVPESDKGPFLNEEQQLIESIADHLALKIDQLLVNHELQEKERRLDKMSQLSRIGYWELDLKTEGVYWSPITKEIHEVEEDYEPNLDTAINFYVEGEYRERIRRLVQKAIEEGEPFDEELLLRTARGNEIWVRAIGDPRHVDGRCVRLSGSFQDIDKRKRAQIESERNRLLLETISRQAESPIWVHDSKGRYLFVNQEWKKVFGLEDREIIGESLFDLFDEHIAREFYEKDQKVVESDRLQKFEEQIMTPQGERYFLTNRFPMTDIPGVGRGVGGVATDITDRIQMEEELKFNSHLLDEIGEAVITTDPNGDIIYWNRAAEQLYGWTESEALGQNVLDVTPTLASKELAAEIFFMLQKGESWSGEFNVKGKDGSEFPVAVTNSPVFDEKGNLIAIIGISSDITERKANEARIMRSLKEKELLLGEVHHRVKNNLAIISSLISLQMETVTDENLRYVLENSRNRIHSIAMVHELLYQAENFSEIPFEEYVRNLMEAIKKTIGFEKNNVRIITEVKVDDLNINQAIPLGLMLNEVITNSLKYAFVGRDKGSIQVKITRSDNNFINVLYADDGNGYPDEINFTDTESLGHILIHTLLKQLKAEYRVDTENKFRLEFKFDERESGSHSNL